MTGLNYTLEQASDIRKLAAQLSNFKPDRLLETYKQLNIAHRKFGDSGLATESRLCLQCIKLCKYTFMKSVIGYIVDYRTKSHELSKIVQLLSSYFLDKEVTDFILEQLIGHKNCNDEVLELIIKSYPKSTYLLQKALNKASTEKVLLTFINSLNNPLEAELKMTINAFKQLNVDGRASLWLQLYGEFAIQPVTVVDFAAMLLSKPNIQSRMIELLCISSKNLFTVLPKISDPSIFAKLLEFTGSSSTTIEYLSSLNRDASSKLMENMPSKAIAVLIEGGDDKLRAIALELISKANISYILQLLNHVKDKVSTFRLIKQRREFSADEYQQIGKKLPGIIRQDGGFYSNQMRKDLVTIASTMHLTGRNIKKNVCRH